ncbi:MAG: D-cysteine desulfhydrase [Verrucomicrobiota bacterium]|jgi:D-cysteine desulfhydrase
MHYPPRLSLAHLPTPIHKLPRLSAETGHELYIWRDDLTGFVESGNKARKLEFLLAHALESGATRIVTSGGIQSNHTRAASFLARRVGLKVALAIREPKTGRDPLAPPGGNLLLNRIAGADLHFFSYAEYEAKGGLHAPFLEQVAQHYRRAGEKTYIIAEGGSMPRGCFGYIRAVEEMLATWRQGGAGTDCPDALFFADGSGGTHAGLHLGFELHGLDPRRLFAVNICDSAAHFQERVGRLVEQTAREFQLPSHDRTLQVFDGHVGAGYGMASDDDFRFYLKVAREEGVLLDPTYTGKAFRGMLAELRQAPARFGRKILFLHSGGTFLTFNYQDQYARLS